MIAWALVPARGGSKSIPLKNLTPLAGVPMLDFGMRAALASGRFERVICSTDHEGIAARAREIGAEIDERPAAHASDEATIEDATLDMFARMGATPGNGLPDFLALVQPTSPFLLPEHCAAVLDALAVDPTALSGLTIAPVSHNHHAFNQRILEDGRVRFRFHEERRKAHSKQLKPMHYVFGNLVAVRPQALLDGASYFAEPSVAVEIPPPYDFDVDAAGDVALAEAYLRCGLVVLPHLGKSGPA